MIKSLRVRIQLWHAVILTFVVLAFGIAFWRQLQRSALEEIDAELLNQARVLEGTLRVISPVMSPAMIADLPLGLTPPFQSPGRRPRLPPPDAPVRRDELRDEDFRDNGFHGPPEPWLRPPYFAIFAADGELLRAEPSGIAILWKDARAPLSFRNVDGRREVLLRGPLGTLIVVGRDVGPRIYRLRQALARLVFLGAAVLVLGLAGGWWLADRAIQPIRRISQTATNVSASNLSERVDTSAMDEELRSLGMTLNSMLHRLERSFQRQSQFTADASHELRTPISVLLTHCELALNRPRTADEYVQTIAICQRAAERMRRLVEGLLILTRSDAGELRADTSTIDLHALATESITMLASVALERQNEIVQSGESAFCEADPAKVGQAILNLIRNAIDYNRPGGSVFVKTWQSDGGAMLSVRDTGIGISADALPKVFDRFYRGDESRSSPSGSGLGLSISKSLIETYGGELTVTSEPGVGSEFQIRCPASTQKKADPRANPSQRRPKPSEISPE